jgi:TfoX/Sxy family transcriptional regulator of competence genes
MPSFEKSPPELTARFDAVTAGLDGVERRKMFGYPALFVGGNLVTGLHQAAWMVRLPDAELSALFARPGARPFEPMPGRPMKGYGVLPPDVVADDAELERWLRRAIDYGRTLPAKG